MYKKIIPIISLFILGFCSLTNAQITFDIGEAFGNQGDNVCVPVTVSGFIDVGGFSFSILYNPLELAPTAVNPDVTAVLPDANLMIPGVINISYALDFVAGTTLPDGDTVLFVCFDILGPAGTVSPLVFSDGTVPSTIVPDAGTVTGMAIPITALDAGFVQTLGGGGALTVTYGSCQTLDIPNPNGSIQMQVGGGVPPYMGTYLEIGNPTNTGAIAFLGSIGTTPTNLPPGDYTISITDAAGDNETTIITINQGIPLLLALANTNPSCAGLLDGSLVLNGNLATNLGGMAPHLITWSAPLTGSGLSQTGLGQGNYTVTVVDANGCFGLETEALIDPPLIIIDSVNQTNVSCLGPGNDGSLSVNGMGGVIAGGSNYTYSWIGPSSFSSNTQNIAGLIPGQYCVTVGDDNNCTETRCFDLTLQVGPTIIGFDKVNIGCAGDMNGVLTVLFTDGDNPPVDIQWDDPASSTTALIAGLGAGIYNVTLTDVVGCFAIGLDSIVPPNPLIFADTTIVQPDCPELTNGLIGITPSGGSGNYTFMWDNGQTTATIFGLACGQSYSVTVSDGSSCPPIVATIDLDCVNAILADFPAASITDVDCDGAIPCDGSATVIAAGGTTASGLYNFIWENGETTNNAGQSTAIALCQGWNNVTISDQDCFIIDSVFIGSPDPITIAPVSINNISCNLGTNGSVTVGASGGTGTFGYAWQGGPMDATYSNLGEGVYTVVVTDANMCTASADVAFDDPDPVVLEVVTGGNTSEPSCAGLSDGAIELTFTGGNAGPASYIWSGNESTSNVAINLAAGTYSITVLDSKGCEDSLMYTLMEPPPITFDLANVIDPPCFGDQAIVVVNDAMGGSGAPYAFSVGSSTRRPLGQAIRVLASNNLSVKVYDANDCFVEEIININEPDEMLVQFPSPIEEVDLGASIFLTPFILTQFPIDSLIWNPATTVACVDSTNLPVSCNNVEATPTANTIYELTVVDINGCEQTASVLVNVDKNRKVYIPNVFSPNNDGINDMFSVFVGPGVEEISSIQVFSRWGEQVVGIDKFIPLSGENIIWDGFFRGKPMNPGVFVYLITAKFLDGAELTFRGDVTVLR